MKGKIFVPCGFEVTVISSQKEPVIIPISEIQVFKTTCKKPFKVFKSQQEMEKYFNETKDSEFRFEFEIQNPNYIGEEIKIDFLFES